MKIFAQTIIFQQPVKAFPVALRDCSDAEGVKVHRGFQRTLDFGDKTTEIRSLDAINEHLEELELFDRPIAITGHSLGGALAILYAAKFRARFPEACAKHLAEVVTFGSPAVGPLSFKGYYGSLTQKTVRIINGGDGVPFTPPVHYHHVGTEIWLNKTGVATDVGWPTRLMHALKTPLSLKSDHSIDKYVTALKDKAKGSRITA